MFGCNFVDWFRKNIEIYKSTIHPNQLKIDKFYAALFTDYIPF